MAATDEAQATPEAGAPPHKPNTWHGIDWQRVREGVKRLQARIVKATQIGKHGKRKALQWLLTHSFSGKAEAVKRVTENHGKRTAGVDGVKWNTPQKKMRAVKALGRRRDYRPLPLRRIYIPKASDPNKLRPLSIPCMADRAEQALHVLGLDPVAEVIQDPNSYGFRKGRSSADALEQVFIALGKPGSPDYALEGDIKACFDSISIEWLEKNLPTDRKMLSKWLRAGYLEKETFFETTAGTPQGGIISPVAANLTLNGMERMLRQTFRPNSKAQRQGKINLIRYADDFVVTGATREVLEDEVKPMIERFLTERGLTLSKEKTLITHIEEGFDFLGCTVRRYEGKLLITPAKKKVKVFETKLKAVVATNPAATAGELIVQLNRQIRGWANYYKPFVSSTAFCKIDTDLFGVLWRWAQKRHRTRSKDWVQRNYFPHVNNRRWVFTGKVASRSGKLHTLHLVRLSSVPIVRHVKIRADANPYDPEWEQYFEVRHHARMRGTLTDRIDLQMLWSRQVGLCPQCHQMLLPEEAWERHHVIWRVMGGSDKLDNLCLLHANCHRKLHAAKPKPKVQNRDSIGSVTGLLTRSL